MYLSDHLKNPQKKHCNCWDRSDFEEKKNPQKGYLQKFLIDKFH